MSELEVGEVIGMWHTEILTLKKASIRAAKPKAGRMDEAGREIP